MANRVYGEHLFTTPAHPPAPSLHSYTPLPVEIASGYESVTWLISRRHIWAICLLAVCGGGALAELLCGLSYRDLITSNWLFVFLPNGNEFSISYSRKQRDI